MDTVSDLSDAVRSREDKLISLIETLVKAKSVTGNEKPAQDVVVDHLKTLGLEVDVWEPDVTNLRDHEAFFETSSYVDHGYEDRPNAVTCIEGADGPTLTVGGHVDVVDVTESEWDYEPWELSLEDEILYGRGVADMKGGIAAILVAIEAILEEGIDLGGDLIFQSVIEEEDGGIGGTLSVLERGYVPDSAIIAEPFNVPNLAIASAGVMYFRIRIPGKSVHAAWGHEGVNAIGKAVKVYEALEGLDQHRKERIDYPPAYRTDPSLEGNVTNLNVGIIESGDWPSTVPSEAVMECRIGWPPGERRLDVREEIESTIKEVAQDDEWLTKHPPEVEWFSWQADPHETDPESDIIQIASSKAESVTGKSGEFIGGNAALDERFYELYYDTPAVSVGPEGNNLHGANEHTTISSLLDTSDIIAHSIVEYLGTE